jgi:ribose transport system substrate-binding protein
MRESVMRLRVLCVMVCGLSLLGGCGSRQPKEARKIGLAVANLQANFFNQIKQSVEAYGQSKGLTVITVDARGDAATQVSQIQDLIAQNIDALIYIPAGATAAAVPVKAARAANIPVINVDRVAEGAPGDTFIATDSVASASEVCRHLATLAGGKGELIVLHGQKGTTPEVDRTKGCAEGIKAFPGVTLVGELWSEGWHQDEGFTLTQDLLQTHSGINLIFGQADALALGAAQAVKVAHPAQRVWIGGFDGDTAALTAIRDGVFDVTATQQTQKMGRMAVDAAIALVKGEHVPPTQMLSATLTTKENVTPFIAEHP